MRKRNVIFVLIFAAVTYFNCLSNDFVRDDPVCFVQNNFYRTWDNFPQIFSKDFIISSDELLLSPESPGGNMGSGVVSYRPVTSTTFFIDSWLWKNDPFGFHLTNLILHILCSILACFLVLAIIKDAQLALLSGLLFAVHPVNSEVVCNISLRSDILAFLFFMISFLCFIGNDSFRGWRKGAGYAVSLTAYFFALFSKESAIVLPFLLVSYDVYFKGQGGIREVITNIKTRYSGYIAVSLFYLYVYFFAFPNSTLNTLGFFDNSPAVHIVTILRIFLAYLKALFLPGSVYILPVLYRPSVEPLVSIVNLFSIAVFLGWIVVTIRTFKGARYVSFFMLWFLLGFLPVSNIIPIANPMAYRFMYLPSLGVLAVVALLLKKLGFLRDRVKSLPTLPKITKALVVGFCMVVTFTLNSMWKNDHTVALAIIKYFPGNPLGYYGLGVEYFNAGIYDKAAESFNKSLDRGLEDPRAFYLLGLCHRDELDTMKQYFKKALAMKPDYVYPYYALGREYLLRREYEKSLPYFKKSIEISPKFLIAYKSLISAYIHLDRPEEAREVFKKAKASMDSKKDVQELSEFAVGMGGKI